IRCVAAWAKEPRMAATLPANMAENARRLNMISSLYFMLRRSNARIERSATAKWRRLLVAHQDIACIDRYPLDHPGGRWTRPAKLGMAVPQKRGGNDGFEDYRPHRAGHRQFEGNWAIGRAMVC